MVAPALRPDGFAIVNATLLTLAPLADRLQAGAARTAIDEGDLGVIDGGMLVADAGVVLAVGQASHCAEALAHARRRAGERFTEIDAQRGLVMPGFVDAHTHALFAGNRIADFEALAAGRKPKLGIAYTVEQTRACSVDQLVDIGARHLALMAAHGTTTAEVKTGYALNARGESDMLRALAILDKRDDLPHVVATFCGAHALPPEFDDYDAFVSELVENILPAIAPLKIARFADAFCERGYFDVAQSRRFLEACAARGLASRLHADEFAASGGTRLAADLHCASADHLNYCDEQGVRLLADAGCTAVLCPATIEYLGLERRAPARSLLEAGVPVALASDFNPGTSPCFGLQTVAHLGRRLLRMTAPEAIAGITLQAARSLLIADAGSLEPGKRADVIVLETRDLYEFGYFYGVNLVKCVVIGADRQV